MKRASWIASLLSAGVFVVALTACGQPEPAGPSAARSFVPGELSVQSDSTDSLSVVITGKFNVKPNRVCVWNAAVTGGTGSNSFTWRKNGAVVGSSQSLTMNTGSASFWLKVDVVSGLQSASDSDFVTVSSSGQNCTT